MNDDDLEIKFRPAAGGVKPQRSGPYTAKDFQLEVLSQMAEMQAGDRGTGPGYPK
jgi:hypothetical protein